MATGCRQRLRQSLAKANATRNSQKLTPTSVQFRDSSMYHACAFQSMVGSAFEKFGRSDSVMKSRVQPCEPYEQPTILGEAQPYQYQPSLQDFEIQYKKCKQPDDHASIIHRQSGHASAIILQQKRSVKSTGTTLAMPEAIRLPGYSANYVSYMSTALATKTVAGISVPSSPLIETALQYARSHLDTSTYNHAIRVWILSIAIAERIPSLANRDKEVQSIAAILHDMACAKDDNIKHQDKAYEINCANAARALVEQHGNLAEWSQSRKQLLWNAVALQTTQKQPEVIATILGILAEYGGPSVVPGNVLSTAEWQSIGREFPRSGLRNGSLQRLCSLCRANPESIYNNVFGGSSGHKCREILANPVDAD